MNTHAGNQRAYAAVSLVAPTEAMLVDARAALAYRLPFIHEMPCGNIFEFGDLDSIGLQSDPCPCGNPNHWRVLCLVDERRRV